MRRLPFSRISQLFVFLITPEDSSASGFHRKTKDQAFYDNRWYGAIKITFWITAVVAFWSTPPVLYRLFFP